MNVKTLGLMPVLSMALWGIPIAALAAPEAIAPQMKQASQIQATTQNDQTLYYTPDAVYELPLRLNAPATVNGLTLPTGTVIQGQLEPVSGGLRYVASHIQAGGLRQGFTATSDTLHDVKDPRETSAGAILGDAAIGAAGGAVIGAILGGGVSAGEVIGGSAAGVIIGNITAQRVVVIQPGQVLTLSPQ